MGRLNNRIQETTVVVRSEVDDYLGLRRYTGRDLDVEHDLAVVISSGVIVTAVHGYCRDVRMRQVEVIKKVVRSRRR